MELKPGSRWKSAVCTAEFVVVRPAKVPVTLECGGVKVVPLGTPADESALNPDHAKGVAAGKRYFDAESGLEILGSKAGKGSLSADGTALTLKEAKALPASD
jgi:hypothetical protein